MFFYYHTYFFCHLHSARVNHAYFVLFIWGGVIVLHLCVLCCIGRSRILTNCNGFYPSLVSLRRFSSWMCSDTAEVYSTNDVFFFCFFSVFKWCSYPPCFFYHIYILSMWYEIEMLILEILLFILGVGATDQEEVLQGCIQNTNFNSRFKALVCSLHNI